MADIEQQLKHLNTRLEAGIKPEVVKADLKRLADKSSLKHTAWRHYAKAFEGKALEPYLLELGTSPARKRVQSKKQASLTRSQKLTLSMIGGMLVVLIVVIGIVGVNDYRLPASNMSVITAQPTLLTIPSQTPVIILATQPPALVDSIYVLPSVVPPTPIATLSPSLLRFSRFPVTVYIDSTDPVWQSALDHSLREINPIVPIVQSDSPNSDIYIEVMPDTTYQAWGGCPKTEETVGCGWFTAARSIGFANEMYEHRGRVLVSEQANNHEGVLLHELLHALGIEQHSDNPGDVLYPVITVQLTLSPNDVALLRDLYR